VRSEKRGNSGLSSLLPRGATIPTHLRRCARLAVCQYSFASLALHLGQTCRVNDPGKKIGVCASKMACFSALGTILGCFGRFWGAKPTLFLVFCCSVTPPRGRWDFGATPHLLNVSVHRTAHLVRRTVERLVLLFGFVDFKLFMGQGNLRKNCYRVLSFCRKYARCS
jgi:hypothetical protein